MKQLQISGVYPHMAVTHQELAGGDECGIGAVVRHGEHLYWITYPASGERGGKGRIYRMNREGVRTECPESTGGTHADRLIHQPSGALVLGANVFFPNGEVRAWDVKACVGRLTAAAVHPRAREGWVYLATMEDGLYEANLCTMEVRTLRRDLIDRLRLGIPRPKQARAPHKLPGDHGKGFYTGQGVAVYANNGHSGALVEWDGQGDPQARGSWRLIEHTNFTEVTGPGGIFGPRSAEDPIWALGWDRRSVLLCVRTAGEWTRYRLPKASYTQDADHGWFTEWPRIRRVCGRYLLCMHGMLYEFPEGFRKGCTGGIRPLARHLKMIADFEEWEGRIVFACDDASSFDNPTLGQCQSNLWFAGPEQLECMSAPSGWGGWYVNEPVREDETSDPLFVGGFDHKVLFLHAKHEAAGFEVEMDCSGDGSWTMAGEYQTGQNKCLMVELPRAAQWVRIRADRDLSECTAYTALFMEHETAEQPALRAGLARDVHDASVSHGRLIALRGPEMKLGFFSNAGYYETDETLTWRRGEPSAFARQAVERQAHNPIEPRLHQTGHSVLVIAPDGRRYQLPHLPHLKDARLFVREVVTERSLLNACGTIYELPRPESGGVLRMKPVTTHGCALDDFLSWRGLLVMSGVELSAQGEHVFCTQDERAAVWCGVVDDLWSLGQPRGEGGPLCDTLLLAGEGSDPFLLVGYRHKTLTLSHDQPCTVEFAMEVDFAATGDFCPAESFSVPPGQTLEVSLPDSFAPHWVRFRLSRDARATALFRLWAG